MSIRQLLSFKELKTFKVLMDFKRRDVKLEIILTAQKRNIKIIKGRLSYFFPM